MEKETKRTLQRMLEIIQEQQAAIRRLQGRASDHGFEDGIADRIERISREVGERNSYTFDWARLCDRHYATRD
jgi:signal transduction histidine kinase